MERVGDLYEYDRKDLIGYGSFAFVYKGRNRKTKAPVAVKCIAKKSVGRSNSLLDKEIKILKELQHENIVGLYECKISSQWCFLVMEFCNGGDLNGYLAKKGTLSEDTIRHFFRQIACAMKAIHDRGILHRDLKPQNLILSHKVANPKPTDIVIKIADFGFARHLQDDKMAATFCGSPIYMAPEVLNTEQYNAKADLWSIGIIIYQCLVGRTPFYKHANNGIKHLSDFYTNGKELDPGIPRGTSRFLSDLLMKLLKLKVAERIDFDDFFCHEFFSSRSKTSPMPVPVRSNESFTTPNSSSTSDCRSIVESPQVEVECSPSIGDPLFLGDSSDSDTEEFVMIEHPFSTTDYGSVPHRVDHTRDRPLRKHSMPLPSHKPIISHRKQLSQGSPKKSLEDRGIIRANSKDFDIARSPFMQRNLYGAVSPITIRYSGGTSRRRAGSGSESDASSHSRPSPVPLPVPTQTGNFQKLDHHIAHTMAEEKRRHSIGRPRSMSPLCVKNVQRRCSLDNITSGNGVLYQNSSKALRNFGSPVEFPTIMENPVMAKAQEMGIKCVIDNKSETLVAQLARAWTAPDLALVSENFVKTKYENSTALHKQGVARENEALDSRNENDECLESILKTDAALGNENSPETEFRFYNQLSDTICEVANEHNMFQHDVILPVTKSIDMDPLHHISQRRKQGEQLLLYMKSLQLVATALHTLRNKVNAGNMVVTPQVKYIGKELNQRYKKCLELCERSKLQCEITEESSINLTCADKILYSQALRDCLSAAIDETFEGNLKLCLRRYERSLVLLEGLSLATNNDLDRMRLSKFKKGVRSRVEILKTNLKT